jgi:hypothetical protein
MTAVTGIYRIGRQFEFPATRTREGAPDGSGFLVEATLTASSLTRPASSSTSASSLRSSATWTKPSTSRVRLSPW